MIRIFPHKRTPPVYSKHIILYWNLRFPRNLLTRWCWHGPLGFLPLSDPELVHVTGTALNSAARSPLRDAYAPTYRPL
jgi:hypothetical protein